MQYSSEVPANSCDICTHSLENVKTVSKIVPKQLRKTVINSSFYQASHNCDVSLKHSPHVHYILMIDK